MNEAPNHFGKRLAQGCAGGFAFSHWLADVQRDHVEPHGHDDAHFMFVVGGAFQTAAGGEVGGPCVIFNPAGTYHSDHFLSGGVFFSVSAPVGVANAAESVAKYLTPSQVGNDAALVTLSRLMRECHAEADDNGLAAESLCFELLGTLEVQQERRPPKWLSAACALLREEHEEQSLAELARRVGVHPIHFTRTFRRFLSCTPGEYRRIVRAKRAAVALITREKSSAAEIAVACGYSDHAHLTRSFRRVFGMTPSHYRRMAVA